MEFIEKVLINAIVAVMGFLLSYSGLTKEIVLAYIMLLSLDYITGIMASYKIRHDLGLELIPEDSFKWEVLNKREEYKLFLKLS